MASEFITGDQLATRIGLTAGTAFNSDAGWLKFSLDYKTLYVAKRPFRYGISWDQLNALGAVFGTMQLPINGKMYSVRLPKGRGDGPTTVITGRDPEQSWGSEWNRLMYHISASPNNGAMTSEGISVGDWAQFSNVELGVITGDGGYNWCQEPSGTGRTLRAYNYISNINHTGATTSNNIFGWRPCLELIND